MRTLARLVGVLVVGVGLVGIVWPDGLLTVGRSVATVPGLYTVAVLRVCIGIILLAASGGSKAPRTLRGLGLVVVIAGLATPLFGVERTRTILEWEAGHGAIVVRLVATVLVVAGGFLVYLMSGGQRGATFR